MIRSFPSQESLVLSPATLGDTKITDQDKAHMALDFVYDLRREFEARDDLFRKIDDAVYLRQKVNIPENFKNSAIEVRSPLPTHIVNQITAALSINVPRVTFEPIDFGDSGYDHAEYREQFFESSWKKQQREKKRRLYRLFIYSLVTKGVAVLKTTDRKNRAWATYGGFSTDLMESLDEQLNEKEIDQESYDRIYDGKTENFKKGLLYPIETSDIPPETFYYQMGENGFVRCAEVKNVPYYETLLRYNAGLNSKGEVVTADPRLAYDNMTALPMPTQHWHKVFQPNQPRYLQMIELWDAKEQTIVIRGPGDIPSSGFVGSGLLVRSVEHNYANSVTGTLNGPYFLASGMTTDSRNHEYANLSVLFAYLHLFPMLNALLTMQTQSAFNFSYPAYKRSAAPTFGLEDIPFGYDAKELHENRKKIVPGAIFPHDIGPMDQPHATIDLDKAIGFIRALLDRALPDSAQGNVTGETAGYAINQASHLASLAWAPLVQNAEETLSDRVGFESFLIENNIGETVWVRGPIRRPTNTHGYRNSSDDQIKSGWIGLGPKQIKGYHEYHVKMEPASINNDALILRNIKEELDMRLIDPAEAVRMRGRNPVEVERAWTLHALKQDPAIQNILKQRIFAQLATIDQQMLQNVPADQLPGGGPPMSGGPAGAVPGISQGLPPTLRVGQQGAVPHVEAGFAGAQPPPSAPGPGAGAPPMSLPGTPGTPTGAPGGVRGIPSLASPIPGGG